MENDKQQSPSKRRRTTQRVDPEGESDTEVVSNPSPQPSTSRGTSYSHVSRSRSRNLGKYRTSRDNRSRSPHANRYHASNVSRSNVSNTNNSRLSGMGSLSRKRSLMLDAAEERAKLRRSLLHERERIELDLINERLAVQVDKSDSSISENRSLYSSRSMDYEKSNRERERETLASKSIANGLDDRKRQYILDWREKVELNNPNSNTMNSLSQNEPLNPQTSGMRINENNLKFDVGRALVETLGILGEATRNTNDSRLLVSRMTSAKELPSFAGDPIEWLRFKQSFEMTTNLGKYSKEENIARLHQALKGEAREAVDALILTNSDATNIMKLLELRFGNPENVVKKVILDIKKLPKIQSGKVDLVTFATKVRNAVAAIQAVNHIGQLHNPELINEIVTKMPSTLIYGFNRYVAEDKQQEPKLVCLSNYLYSEAEMSSKAGTNQIKCLDNKTNAKEIDKMKYKGNSQVRPVLLSTSRESIVPENKDKTNMSEKCKKCTYCNKEKHTIIKCFGFKNLSIDDRWKWVEKNRVCFNCLIKGHSCRVCKMKHCDIQNCGKKHNRLLHRVKKTAGKVDLAGNVNINLTEEKNNSDESEPIQTS